MLLTTWPNQENDYCCITSGSVKRIWVKFSDVIHIIMTPNISRISKLITRKWRLSCDIYERGKLSIGMNWVFNSLKSGSIGIGRRRPFCALVTRISLMMIVAPFSERNHCWMTRLDCFCTLSLMRKSFGPFFFFPYHSDSFLEYTWWCIRENLILKIEGEENT